MRVASFTLFALTLLFALVAAPAEAGFVGGVEKFNGTSLDTNTWEFFSLNQGWATASQDNALILSGMTDADYTTQGRFIHPGDTVRVDATLNGPPGLHTASLSLFLTNNSGDLKSLSLFDSDWLELEVVAEDTMGALRGSDVGGSGHVLLDSNGGFPLAPPLHVPATYQIAYLSPNRAAFSAFGSDGKLLGGHTLNFDEKIPKDLAISLFVRSGTSATFDNVTVTSIPLPRGALSGALLVVLIVAAVSARRFGVA
jgi:hypothetical protein